VEEKEATHGAGVAGHTATGIWEKAVHARTIRVSTPDEINLSVTGHSREVKWHGPAVPAQAAGRPV